MDYYCAHEWINIREDTLNYINKLHENAFKHFLQEIGLKDTFAYKYDYETNTFTVYTCRPGIWIGKGGKGVNRLKEILSQEVKENCNVEFVEIRGRFITCK